MKAWVFFLSSNYYFRYEDVNITNFHTSWRNGMAFCALIHSHKPELLDYSSCDPNQPIENLEKAFTVAEDKLGVTRLLEPEGVLYEFNSVFDK